MNEDFPARVEASFPDRDSAAAAARALCHRFDFDETQLSIVSAETPCATVHRNRYAFKASGRRLQKRQLVATFTAFALISAGLGLLHFIGEDTLPAGVTYTVMAAIIFAAVTITVIGLTSWRPEPVETRRSTQGGEAVLVIRVHDVSEQYVLRGALLEMGARVEGAESAGVA